MTSYDLSTATSPDGTTGLSGGNVVPTTSTWHYFHVSDIPALNPSTYYLIEIDYIGGDTVDGTGIDIYSQLSPDLDGYNNSWWATIGDFKNTGSGSGTVSWVAGPGEGQWDIAVTEGEPYLIFEFWDDSPYTLEITAIRISETGKPPPPEVIWAASGTYPPDLMAWNGERSYFCAWGGSNIPKFKMQISEDWKTVTKGPHTEAFVVFQASSREVVNDIVPYRTTTAFSGANYVVRCMNLDDDALAKTDEQVYPVNPLMSGNPQIRTMIVPLMSGEIYLISRSSVSPATPTLWKCTVDSEGNMTAFTSLGTMTYPSPGAFPGGGTNYHSVSMDPDPQQISDNIFYMGQNRGIWNKNIPLVIKEAHGIAGTVNGMDATLDLIDPGMGVGSAIYLKPGHLLIGQRSQGAINSSLQCQLTDILLDSNGDAVSRRHWLFPTGFYPGGFTWAKMPDGTIDAVVSMRDNVGNNRVFYNVFDNPTEWTFPAGWVLQQIPQMAPSERAGWVMSVNYSSFDTRFVSVQLGGGMGRLKVWTGSEWKYATPKSGENAGLGRLRQWNGSAWVPADGMEV